MGSLRRAYNKCYHFYFPNIFADVKMFLSMVFCFILIATGRAAPAHPKNDTDSYTGRTIAEVSSSVSLEEELITGFKPQNKISDIAHYDYVAKNRRKRSPILFQIGAAAVNFLLRGAKQIRSRSQLHKRFEKQGDFETALKDFYSVDPRDVRVFMYSKGMGKGVSKLTGQVGDRQMTLKKISRADRNKPALEIREPKQVKFDFGHTNTILGEPYNRIIYTKVLDK